MAAGVVEGVRALEAERAETGWSDMRPEVKRGEYCANMAAASLRLSTSASASVAGEEREGAGRGRGRGEYIIFSSDALS